MMLYPAMSELNAQIHNRYMLVNVVARRARQIAEAYEEAHQILDEKPVTMAINEVADGILEDPEQVQDAADAAPDTEDDTDEE
ncbi:MAG: DNA-directed RNA polymerase subunit omega [Oscillibacter sp.]|nr:DNA-directed RNA polymerase subunit omega [Oscillibacter sp.]MBQ7681786.1 DNA-directed RNA polymerase subunit omega [Oscillibacter sp.]MBQ9618835.1 DNA-directed RNA polymerase subunit omega [Oscillibacter sp.]